MKKLLTLFTLLITITCSAQFDLPFKEQNLTYNMADGNGNITTDNFIRYNALSFQIDGTGLDAADATVQVQKSNNGTNFVNISGATATLASGTATSFIEVSGAKNEFYKLVITVNTVTTGTLSIDLTGSR